MKPKRGMFVCGTLQREVVEALAAEGLSDVEIVGFPCECGQQARSAKAFEHVWRSRADEFAQLLVLGEPCLPAAHLQAMAAGYANIRFMVSGFELFLPKVLVQDYQRDGAYLLTPGWLANWPERIKCWGFDQATAEAFFAESCARLLLLDTGTDDCSSAQLKAFAAFVNRPGETVPVGLEMLRLRLAQHWRDWPQTPSAPVTAPVGTPSAVDYAMIFDLLSRLVGFASETDLARGLFELFEMICAPAGLAYLPFRGGKAGEMIISPDATITSAEWVERLSGLRSDCTWLSERDGFVMRFQRNREMLGALLVDRVALPLRKADYLNLTLTILPVLTLAIASTRNQERLIHTADVLRNSERMLSESQRLGHVGSWFTDRNGTISWSEEMYRLYGVSRETFTPTVENFLSLIHPDDRLAMQAWITACAAEVEPDALEYRINMPDGTIRFLKGCGSACYDTENRLTHMAGTAQDITEPKQAEAKRRKLEKTLQQKQKLAAVGTLACGMGHEINNPIMGIINYAQLIKDRLQGKNEALEEFAGEILIEAERIAGIVRGLSAFASRDTAARVSVPVSDLVESALAPLRAALTHDHIKLAVEVPADLPAVTCDRQQIAQVLTSLLSNASDALNERYPGHDENKIIRVTARDLDTEHRTLKTEHVLRITVEDHGTGIPLDVRGHIFEPFFTTKDRSVGSGSIGKGLGLFVSYASVQEHGGLLNVESEPGQWARFHVDLPIADSGLPDMVMDDTIKEM